MIGFYKLNDERDDDNTNHTVKWLVREMVAYKCDAG